nr:hypothetical protein [Tanacetum cinerariifolium]GEZ29778.1 hypothetical protein [Tanacetum cinerariifolium]
RCCDFSVVDFVIVVVVFVLLEWLCLGVAAVVVVVPDSSLECLDDHMENDPITYHVGDDIDIQFGRDEFCLITGLKFGVGYGSDYEVGHILFRRRVFNSITDGYKITARMLDKRLRAHSLLSLGTTMRWDMYSWGLYIRPSLYYSLRNANMKRWPALYAPMVEQVDKTLKYMLSGFTWAFKTWILESYRVRALEFFTRLDLYPITVAWRSNGKFIDHISQVSFLRTPDAIEARSNWWVSNRGFFDGLIREPPRIPSPVNPHMQDDPPVDIYQRLEEHDREMQEMKRQQAEMDDKIKKKDSSSSEQVLSESVYELADTTVAPKKRPDKSKNKARNGKAPAFDLGNADLDDNVGVNEVLIMDARATDDYICYKNVDPNKVNRAIESFWRELVPDLYIAGYYNFCNNGNVSWLSDDAHGARYTMAKAGTASKHPGSQQFVIVTDEHIKGTLDGTTRPYP